MSLETNEGRLDKIQENIIEIAWVYQDMRAKGSIPDDIDSLAAKECIIQIARDFEKDYAGVDWDESALDYYEEIDRFSRDFLINIL